jgi:hypothetical protein
MRNHNADQSIHLRSQCDEVKPVCSNCRRRYDGIESCEWKEYLRVSKRRRTFRSEMPTTKTPVVPTGQAYCRIALRPNTLSHESIHRSVELRLMHHYTSVVSPSMPDCEAGVALQMWQQRIPQLAFESDVVLNPMLALSALHIHAHSGHDPNMEATLRRYLHRGLQHHRQALVSEERNLSEATWLSAVILSNINWLLARYQDCDGNNEYELPLQMWKMFHGVGTLFTQQRRILDSMGYGWYGEKLRPSIKPIAQLSIAARAQLRLVEEDMNALSEAFKMKEMPSREADIYLEARDYVVDQYRAFYSGTSARVLRWYIGTMVSNCHTDFREKLENHDPLAMSLLARALVLMQALENIWWMNGVGEYRVLERDIPGIEELMPQKLRWTMRWPRSILDGSMELCIPGSNE